MSDWIFDKSGRAQLRKNRGQYTALLARVKPLGRKTVAEELRITYGALSRKLRGFDMVTSSHVDAIEAACRSLENCGVENHSPKGE